ncbi:MULTISPECIES: alkaline phosphatase D family protein [unclassified Arthrobacter]|uniref:alkaline phosphatase D family protein n=1 Tax=unclassified Arthrobacter TaxID=235627 RepID=UPI00149174C2|nr:MULTISPECIES: alkaline phosphatase D family protein [unclassified Arthrobacter]MBE0008604.1 alkaline phosphatase family protein [Arthrobacter sp. AET 35A]NOJ62438.1 alkaline phosphatase family protein [Arthrobacter sp. 147(2020)]
MTDSLVLGPMMRYVDLTSASIWVETRRAALVTVTAGQRSWTARTFGVHGHHYALVEVDGLEPGSVSEYTVSIDGELVWPEEGSQYPPSKIGTLAPGKPIKMAFGSCRTSVPHNEAGNGKHGVDSMRAYALNMANGVDDVAWPDLVVFLGDQVYADVTSDAMQEFIKARRDISEEPGEELKDYEEYAHLYNLAWSDDANRWLLSTLPSAMIFDDHDIRDDWNTSLKWKQSMEETSWWQGRIVSGLGSYWVHQHLGNLSPEHRAGDEIWQVIAGHQGEDELDISDVLDRFADRANQQPSTYRWSYAREIGDVRLVVVDSRAGRVLDPARRSILDEQEMDWLDGQMQGGFRHLLIATSLPFLLPAGLHHIEAWNEALADGAWGKVGAKIGEKMRRTVDLEHWGAFQRSFRTVARMAVEVADGLRGAAPETVTFLSGDVHFSYVSEVERTSGSRIIQAVCSPIRNPLPRAMRFATAILSYGVASPVGALVARSAKVPNPPFRWSGLKGPWFDNNLAGLQDGPDGLRFWWERGVVVDGDHLSPQLEQVSTVTVSPRTSPAVTGSSQH